MSERNFYPSLFILAVAGVFVVAGRMDNTRPVQEPEDSTIFKQNAADLCSRAPDVESCSRILAIMCNARNRSYAVRRGINCTQLFTDLKPKEPA